MRKSLLAFLLIGVLVLAQLIATAPARKSLRAQLNPSYIRAMAAYRRLEPRLPREDLRAITAIGILNGARQAEQQMEHNLVEVVQNLLLHTDMNDEDQLMPKIVEIEEQLTRDHRALEILSSAMDLAIGAKNARDFRADMQKTLSLIRRQGSETAQNDELKDESAEEATGERQAEKAAEDLGKRVAALRQQILTHVNSMKTMVEEKIEHTLEHLIEEADEDSLLAKASNKVLRKRDASELQEEPAEIRMIKSILTEDDFRHNLVEGHVDKRKDNLDSLEDELDFKTNSKQVSNETITLPTTAPATNGFSLDIKPAKQEEGSPELSPGSDEPTGGGGGGLVGIISSLSGGEGGSDIGALIGALTGVISTLFGPNGLDIESLISTATSLISGLLSGNKNFGTVLGIYVGTAFDGLSGGGGAINNGQFLGNFLGTVVASLSADPEEDDAPPRPFIFAQNLLSSFLEAKNRKSSAEASEERKGYTSYGNKGDAALAGGGGSDSGSFIKQIVSHLVGGVVSLILNASLGASGGASQASSSLFHSSSSAHMKPAAAPYGAAGKSW